MPTDRLSKPAEEVMNDDITMAIHTLGTVMEQLKQRSWYEKFISENANLLLSLDENLAILKKNLDRQGNPVDFATAASDFRRRFDDPKTADARAKVQAEQICRTLGIISKDHIMMLLDHVKDIFERLPDVEGTDD